MKKRSVREIQAIIGGEIIGDQDFLVSNISPIENIKEESIVIIKSKKYISTSLPKDILLITSSKLFSKIRSLPRAVIKVEDVEASMIKLLEAFYPVNYPKGISKSAVLSDDIVLGKEIYIGDTVVIGKRCVIEDNVKIFPGVYIGKEVHIGENTIIYPHVIILDNVFIGKNCVIQAGSVLGGDGFGYAKIEGKYKKIPQVGKLIIKDEVEIGPLCVIDRGALKDTVIEKGVKIDALVKIAHNVVIGENSIITAQVGIAGSSNLGKNVIMGGQAGISDHITVGDNVVIAADSGVISNIPSNSFVSGSPAIDHIKEYKAKALMYKLPEIVKTLKKLEKDLSSLKEKILKNE